MAYEKTPKKFRDASLKKSLTFFKFRDASLKKGLGFFQEIKTMG